MSSLLLVVLLGLLNGEEPPSAWRFDKDVLGKEPAGFAFEKTVREAAGKWQVAQDEDNQVLTQLDRERDRGRYFMALVKDSSFEDLKISVRIKAVDGKHDQAGGVVWRYKNPGNYLAARLDVVEQNVRLYRFIHGNRIQFGVQDDLDLKQGQWYTLRVEHCGKYIKVYLDDDVLFIERDRHFTRPGRIGLWTKPDSVMYFDDLQVKKIEHKQEDDDDDEDDDQ